MNRSVVRPWMLCAIAVLVFGPLWTVQAEELCADALLPALQVNTGDRLVLLERVRVRPNPDGSIETLIPMRTEKQSRVYVYRDHQLKTVLAYNYDLVFIDAADNLSALYFTQPGIDPLTGKPDMSVRITEGAKPGLSYPVPVRQKEEVRTFEASVPHGQSLVEYVRDRDGNLLRTTIHSQPGSRMPSLKLNGRGRRMADRALLVNDETGAMTTALATGALIQFKGAPPKVQWALERPVLKGMVNDLYRLNDHRLLCVQDDGNLVVMDDRDGTILHRYDLAELSKRLEITGFSLAVELIRQSGRMVFRSNTTSDAVYYQLMDSGDLKRLGKHMLTVENALRFIPVLDETGRFRVFSVHQKNGQVIVREHNP